MRDQLDAYKHPREVVFVDSLPRTHLGKVDRGSLRRPLMADPILSIVPRQKRAAARDPEPTRPTDRPRLPGGTWIQVAIASRPRCSSWPRSSMPRPSASNSCRRGTIRPIASNPWIKGLTLENIRFAIHHAVLRQITSRSIWSHQVDYQFGA